MYMAYFSDGTSISEYEFSWKALPNAPITKLSYHLPNGKRLIMEGFSAYTIIKEYYQFVYGAKGKVLDTINILGKYNDKVYQFSLHMRKGKAFQSINKLDAEFKPIKLKAKKGEEYTLELGKAIKINESFWKKGFEDNVKVNII